LFNIFCLKAQFLQHFERKLLEIQRTNAVRCEAGHGQQIDHEWNSPKSKKGQAKPETLQQSTKRLQNWTSKLEALTMNFKREKNPIVSRSWSTTKDKQKTTPPLTLTSMSHAYWPALKTMPHTMVPWSSISTVLDTTTLWAPQPF
jgi:hypothetical protein